MLRLHSIYEPFNYGLYFIDNTCSVASIFLHFPQSVIFLQHSPVLQHSTVRVKKFYPLRFSEFFPQRLRFFKQNFTRLLYVYIYAKRQNFLQLSLNLTKLCHIKRNRPVNFHLSQCMHELLLFDDKQRVKTHNSSHFFWNSEQSSVKIFLYKVPIVCSECPPLAKAHAFRLLRKSLIALLIVVCGKSSQIYCNGLFSSVMVSGFDWSSWNAWSIAPHTRQSSGLRSGETGGHSSFAMKSVQWNVKIHLVVALNMAYQSQI